jgi:hypothetical protein
MACRMLRNQGSSNMGAKFDVFTRLPNGHPLWVDSFESLEEARALLKELARNAMAGYFIYSEERGIVESINPGETTAKTS